MRFLAMIYLTGYIVWLLSACSENAGVTNLGTASSCDVSSIPCTVMNDGYVLKLALGPDVKVLTPFDIKLTIKGADVLRQSVTMDFTMANMDMGMNRYRLSGGSDMWIGKATLPVCTASRTDWLATVEFTADDNRKFSATFPFHTDVR